MSGWIKLHYKQCTKHNKMSFTIKLGGCEKQAQKKYFHDSYIENSMKSIQDTTLFEKFFFANKQYVTQKKYFNFPIVMKFMQIHFERTTND